MPDCASVRVWVGDCAHTHTLAHQPHIDIYVFKKLRNTIKYKIKTKKRLSMIKSR